MITGFNTDIEYQGVVYHVQTEDKGLDSPLILSLVYSGGAILASKRSRYEDLIATGFNEEELAERLKRQHRLICAAINAGRLEELKRMGGGHSEKTADKVAQKDDAKVEEPAEIATGAAAEPVTESEFEFTTGFDIPGSDQDSEVIPIATEDLIITNAFDYAAFAEAAPPLSPPAPDDSESPEVIVLPADDSPYTVHDSRRQPPLGSAPKELGVIVSILDEEEFRAGQIFHIRVLVEHRTLEGGRALAGVPLSVKILGTAFRPQLYTVKTGRDGVAVISAQIPLFTSGRAAILIRAEAEGKAIETRRVIHSAF